jgi:hypothetical protein
LGLGAEYASKDKHNALPISFYFKITMVLDQRLANQGALVKALYDLDGNLIAEGEKSKVELGFLLTGFYKKKYSKTSLLKTDLVCTLII